MYWTTTIEEEGEDASLAVVLHPSIRAQLGGLQVAELKRRVYSLLEGRSPHDFDQEMIDKVVQGWLDEQVERGWVVLPQLEEKEE